MHQKGALFVQQQETWSLNTRYCKKLITVRNITKTIPNSAFCWNAHPFWFQEVQKKYNLLLLEYRFPVRKPPSFDFKCLNSEKKFIKFNIYCKATLAFLPFLVLITDEDSQLSDSGEHTMESMVQKRGYIPTFRDQPCFSLSVHYLNHMY